MRRSKSLAWSVLWKLFIATLIIFVFHVALKYLSIEVYDQQHGFLFELSNRFDVNDENSVPQWFSQIIFLLIGVSAFLAARFQTVKTSRRLWLAIGFIGLILSLDDVATLHEFVLQSIHNTYFLDISPNLFVNAWLILIPVVLVIAAILAWWNWTLLPRRTFMLLVLGGSIFIIGKVMMDSLANVVDDLFFESGITQGAEKFFQYIGSSIVLYANLQYIEEYHGGRVKKALSYLKSDNPANK